MLGVSPNTLRSWERRYGFPSPQRSAGGHRQYALGEIEALRLTLAETHNVSSAISLARERGEGPSSSSRLAAAFGAFDEEKANRLLEESLTLRSYERTIEEVLLEAVATHHDPRHITAEYEFAWRHATGWLSALKRLAPPAHRPDGILIFDAALACDLDALHAQALDIVLRRAGTPDAVADARDRPDAARPRRPRAVAERHRAHRQPRVARRDRPARLRRPRRRAGGRRVRLPRRRPGHRREHGVSPRGLRRSPHATAS